MERWHEIDGEGFDLDRTLASGQCFLYAREGDHYVVRTRRRAVRVAQRGARVRFSGASEAFVRRLFALDGTHEPRLARLASDGVLSGLLRERPEYRALRVMRQGLHETILCFICSSNASIPKIRMSVHLLAQRCGTAVGGHAHLPAPGVALDEARVREAKTGYRARFIVGANRMLTPAALRRISRAPYPRSHALLMELPGVGAKVADCVCLFGLDQGEAFPVDVHVLRAMRALFPQERFANERDAKAFAQRRWGADAGIAQQLIFEWARERPRVPRVAQAAEAPA